MMWLLMILILSPLVTATPPHNNCCGGIFCSTPCGNNGMTPAPFTFPTLPTHSFPTFGTLPPHNFPTLPPHNFPTLPPQPAQAFTLGTFPPMFSVPNPPNGDLFATQQPPQLPGFLPQSDPNCGTATTPNTNCGNFDQNANNNNNNNGNYGNGQGQLPPVPPPQPGNLDSQPVNYYQSNQQNVQAVPQQIGQNQVETAQPVQRPQGTYSPEQYAQLDYELNEAENGAGQKLETFHGHRRAAASKTENTMAPVVVIGEEEKGNRVDHPTNEVEKMAKKIEERLLSQKCNDERLRKIILDNIDKNPSSSKRKVQKAASEQIGGLFDVICSQHDFSYLANTQLFCEAGNEEVTCFAFLHSILQ